MAQHLSISAALLLSCQLLMAGFSHVALAESLQDPTMPPNAMGQATTSSASAAPVLQSIMLGPQHKAAMINGQTVLLGKKYQQSVLVKVGTQTAVLQAPDGSTQTLTLQYPQKLLPTDKTIRPIKPAPGAPLHDAKSQ